MVAQWQSGEVASGTVAPSDTQTTQASPGTVIRQTEIAAWLANRLGEIMGFDPQSIDLQEPMASFGLDSLRVVRLSAELEDWLGLKLSPTLAYDYPTIASLSAYLAHQLDPQAAASQAAPQAIATASGRSRNGGRERSPSSV